MKGFVKRVSEAIKIDPSIVVDRANIRQAKGHTLERLEYLGIREADLMKLEKNGMAARGLMPTEEKTPFGSRKSGHRVKWLLIRD